jgi:hypothetical protein
VTAVGHPHHDPTAESALEDLTMTSSADAAKISLLGSLPAFRGHSRHDRERLTALADEARLPAGHVLRRDDELSRFAVVVAEGRARLMMGDAVLAELGPGSMIGAAPLNGSGSTRGACLVAATATTVYLIDRRYLTWTPAGDFGTASNSLPEEG